MSTVTYKSVYGSVRRVVLYNILIEFQVPKKLATLIKVRLHETQSKARIGKHLSENVPIENGIKRADALTSMLFNFASEYAIKKAH
jgi:hypothetical protein